jgi:starch phosphorylase
MSARARIRLGALMPEDVAVELYLGRLDPSGDIVDAGSTLMKTAGRDPEGRYVFEAAGVPCSQSGLHGFTVRIRPSHPDLAAGGRIPFLPGLIAWAEPDRAGVGAGKP